MDKLLYEKIEDLFRDVAEYVEFFNSKRIHQKLRYKTSDKIEEMYKKSNCYTYAQILKSGENKSRYRNPVSGYCL